MNCYYSKLSIISQVNQPTCWIRPDKKYIHALNILIYHVEVPIALYGEDSIHTVGHKRKSYRHEKPMEDIHGNKNSKPKVEIHDILKKHFTNGI